MAALWTWDGWFLAIDTAGRGTIQRTSQDAWPAQLATDLRSVFRRGRSGRPALLLIPDSPAALVANGNPTQAEPTESELPDDFLEFLRLLSEHRVEYLFVGGYVVG